MIGDEWITMRRTRDGLVFETPARGKAVLSSEKVAEAMQKASDEAEAEEA